MPTDCRQQCTSLTSFTLRQFLKDKSDDISGSATEALSLLQDHDSFEVIFNRKPGSSIDKICAWIMNVSRFKNPKVIPAIKAYEGHSSKQVREAAAFYEKQARKNS